VGTIQPEGGGQRGHAKADDVTATLRMQETGDGINARTIHSGLQV